MNTMYNDDSLRTVADVISYLHNPVMVDITLAGTAEQRSDWIFERLNRFLYRILPKKDKGIILRYFKRVTGLSEKQLDRHVRAYKQ